MKMSVSNIFFACVLSFGFYAAIVCMERGKEQEEQYEQHVAHVLTEAMRTGNLKQVNTLFSTDVDHDPASLLAALWQGDVRGYRDSVCFILLKKPVLEWLLKIAPLDEVIKLVSHNGNINLLIALLKNSERLKEISFSMLKELLDTLALLIKQAYSKSKIRQHEELFKLLLENAPDVVHSTDVDGKTLLHYAIQLRLTNIVRFLLHHSKAEIYMADKSGQMPFDIMYNGMAEDNNGELYYEHDKKTGKVEFKGTNNFIEIEKLLLEAKQQETVKVLIAHGARVADPCHMKAKLYSKQDLRLAEMFNPAEISM